VPIKEKSNMSELIGFSEIAKQLNLEVTTVRRFVARKNEELKLTLHRGKGLKLFLTREDADKVIANYEAKRGPLAIMSEEEAKFDRSGYFYIIQLIPEALPNRVKIGYADNVDQRLNEHRTAAPTARLLKAWPCKRSWDYAVMDSITREGCKLVLNEVYEGDIDGFLSRADDFFAIMPAPNNEKELSEHSPLYESEEDEILVKTEKT
jgi:hypothetical protein